MTRLAGWGEAERAAARRRGYFIAAYAIELEESGAADSLACRWAWLGVVVCDLRATLWGYRGRSQYDLFGPAGRHRPPQG